MDTMNVNDLWSQFMEGDEEMMDYMETIQEDTAPTKPLTHKTFTQNDLSIATKTMIAYLNQPVDIRKVFWELPLIQYHEPRTGIVKKQIKWTCETDDHVKELENYIEKHDHSIPMTIDILKQMDKGRFKDIRKINIGLCKKSLMSYRSKKKSAFYNCIVSIVRILDLDNNFKEIHIKLFNTGKMEIPGIQDDRILFRAVDTLVYLLNHTSMTNVRYSKKEDDLQTVLINSNFHCGYTVNRQALYERLKFHYGFNALYDPCKYPGVQCKFYYKRPKSTGHMNTPFEQDGICQCDTPCSKKGRPRNAPTGPCLELTFMVFRTGSILIVGHCKESVLREVYMSITRIMTVEKSNCMLQDNVNVPVKPQTNKRQRKLKLSIPKSCFETYEKEKMLNDGKHSLYASSCITIPAMDTNAERMSDDGEKTNQSSCHDCQSHLVSYP